MDKFLEIMELINNELLGTHTLTIPVVVYMLFIVTLLSAYVYIIYRMFSHRAFYNKSFHTGITILPFFISTIILSLQSNLVITLGTIGALAIIRFRTAVKDPVDMIYILWAVHIGICCGCQLYVLAVVTSVFVTFALGILDYLSIKNVPYTLVVNSATEREDAITEQVKLLTKKFRVKSRNYTKKGLNMVIELFTNDVKSLGENLSKNTDIERFSIIEYDYEDIV